MHLESLLYVVDELDEFTVLLEDLATLQGACLLAVMLNGLLVGVRTGSFLIGAGAAAAGLLVSAAVATGCARLRDRAHDDAPLPSPT